MSHPNTRAERRHQREQIIAYRRFIYLYVWNRHKDYQFMKEVANPLIDIMDVFERWKDYPHQMREYPEWGRYARWNLNCTCWRCQYRKSYKSNAKRRRALKSAAADWELEYKN